MNFLRIFEQEAIGGRTMVKLCKLKEKEYYNVEQFRIIDTMYGRRIAADLSGFIWTILPKRLADMAQTQAEIDILNRKKYKLAYMGCDSSRKNMFLIDLKPINSDFDEEEF